MFFLFLPAAISVIVILGMSVGSIFDFRPRPLAPSSTPVFCEAEIAALHCEPRR